MPEAHSQIKLTVGMAVYDDFDGAYFTIQHLREQEADALRDCELIVADNNPGSPQGKRLKHFVEGWVCGDFARATYVPYTETIGTAAPRDQVFRRAQGIYVLCLDSHVILQRGALASLRAHLDAHPETRDLLCGPMIYDDRRSCATHFTDVWRHGMWGVWGGDPRGDVHRPDCTGEPFEIGAQGLGLFACRKDVWEEIGGFNAQMNGFGGEEWYIHEKFRRDGGRVLCIPQLRWIHRFNEGQTYPRTNVQKVRNYVIGHRELGLPLDRVHSHFVLGINEDGSSWDNDGSHPPGTEIKRQNVLTQQQWDALIRDPIPSAAEVEKAGRPVTACATCQSNAAQTLDELFASAASTPSDINEHCHTLKELAASCERVTEFGVRHGVSTAALLAGRPKWLASYDLVEYPEVRGFLKLAEGTRFEFHQADSLTAHIEPTDLLFIDTKHTGEHLAKELARHHERVLRFIVLHDTVIFGETGEDGSPGLLHAIRAFVRANPEWSVVRHDTHNHGLMVLSRDPRDKPQLPSLVAQAWNYAAALTKQLANGNPRVTEAEHQARLDVCAICPLLNAGRCSQCGCPVDEKALFATETCPHPLGSQWPAEAREEKRAA